MKNTSSQIVDVIEIKFVLKKNKCTITEQNIPEIAKKKSNNIRGLFEGEILHNITCMNRKKNIPANDDEIISFIYSALSNFKISRKSTPKKFINFPKKVRGPTLGFE